MWIPIGKNTRVRAVSGGRTIERHCSECDQVRRFVECDVADKVSLFFIPAFDMTNRRMVCPECGEDFEVPSGEGERAPRAAVQPSAKGAGPPPKPSEDDLEKMLADLKKKMDR